MVLALHLPYRGEIFSPFLYSLRLFLLPPLETDTSQSLPLHCSPLITHMFTSMAITCTHSMRPSSLKRRMLLSSSLLTE